MRSTVAIVLLILVVGILIGLALAEWLLGAAAAIGVTLLILAVVLVAYLMIRAAFASRECSGPRDER